MNPVIRNKYRFWLYCMHLFQFHNVAYVLNILPIHCYNLTFQISVLSLCSIWARPRPHPLRQLWHTSYGPAQSKHRLFKTYEALLLQLEIHICLLLLFSLHTHANTLYNTRTHIRQPIYTQTCSYCCCNTCSNEPSAIVVTVSKTTSAAVEI